MALHILNTGPTTGEKFAQSLATGLSALAEGKIQQIKQRNEHSRASTGFEALLKQAYPDMAPEEHKQLAGSYAGLSPNERREVTKGLSKQVTESQYMKNAQKYGIAETGGGLLPARNPKEALEQQKFQLQREEALTKRDERKQKAIDATNEPFNKEWHNTVTRAKDIIRLQTGRLEDIYTGKVQSRDWGIWPHSWQTKETQQYIDKGAELAPIIAANKGVATNFKIKLIQRAKGDIDDDTETQIAIALENIDAAKEVLAKEKIRNDLIAENNGEQPKNLNALMEKRYEETEKDRAQGIHDSLDDVKKELMDNNAPVGTMITDDEGNTLYWNGKDLVEKL